ncbi:MAG: cation diffusion facilitator family transporter [Desulfotomaculaceae bacterium]|nr:cation diffusion facilitator family transporter [Desulfotomaculaceae bacterium]
MIKPIISKFIKDYQNVTDPGVREAYGVLSGVLGIICNLFLFFIKFFIGIYINSIAVISDAFNNLSDLGSSIINIFGAKISGSPPDPAHPYGHGRFEYIASLIIAFIIFAFGLQLLKSSFDKIINPEPVIYNPILIAILFMSIFIKLWMYSYNTYIAGKINSSINSATASDSLNDALATGGVIAGTMLGNFVSFPVDGLLGLIISILIIYTGFGIARDSINLILGPPPDPEVVKNINAIMLECNKIEGTHGLLVHDYGPGKIMASVHADVARNGASPVEISTEIDEIQRSIKDRLGIDILIHVDIIQDGESKA